MYEIGKIYIWQNCVGDCAYLNESETTVTTAVTKGRAQDGQIYWCQHTDTVHRHTGDVLAVMGVGNLLRLKNPPSGEQLVRDLFIRTPTTAQWIKHHAEGLVDEWREANPKIADFWRQQPAQAFNCRCVPLPIAKPDAS